jgi:hypothetical protein
MTALARVLVAKLTVTAVVWAGPLLLVPRSVLEAGGLHSESVALARLLGCAYLALGVGYWLGLREELAGRYPGSTVAVGIVSNAGGGACMAYFVASGSAAGWHPLLRFAAWASAPMALAIALGLYWFGAREHAARERARGAPSAP